MQAKRRSQDREKACGNGEMIMSQKRKCIINGRLILPDGIVDGKVLVFDDKIRAIADQSLTDLYQDCEVIDAKGAYVSPGLIDVHMHGCGGDDTSDGKDGAIQRMSRMIAGFGVTGWLPTTMTLGKDTIRKAFEQVRKAKKESEEDALKWGGAQVLGANMEGPFINIERKGAQAGEFVIEPDVEFTEEYQDIIRLVTIAPEVKGGLDYIKRISAETKIRCSVGHTMADYETCKKAFGAGANHVTHLFNAQPGLHHRNPGVAGAALADPNVYTEMICDTFHINPGVFQIVCDCKKDKLVLITDCMRAGGLPDGDYTLGGQEVHVKGIQCLLNSGTIAGSVLRLNKAVYNLAKNTDWSLAQCVRAASLSPAKSIGVDKEKGSIELGKDADILIADQEFEICDTFVRGEKVYER